MWDLNDVPRSVRQITAMSHLIPHLKKVTLMISALFEGQSAKMDVKGIVTVLWSCFCNPSEEILFSWLLHQPG